MSALNLVSNLHPSALLLHEPVACAALLVRLRLAVVLVAYTIFLGIHLSFDCERASACEGFPLGLREIACSTILVGVGRTCRALAIASLLPGRGIVSPSVVP
jgi:hypothetical protein